jgi:hydrogenase maturation protease
MDVLVLGLGNTLLADDGVGIHVVRSLAADPVTPRYMHPIDGGTLGFRLTDALTRSNAVILVDATHFNQPAGTVRMLSQGALAAHLAHSVRTSAHEAGLIDLLTLARMEGWMPSHLSLVGIQPHHIGWGEELSDPVSRGCALACRTVVQTARAWQ